MSRTSRHGNQPPWRLAPREQRRALSKPRAAQEARARKAQLPFERAREIVRTSGLMPGCIRIIDAFAERHTDLGAKLADQPVYQAYGHKGDRRRERGAKPTDLPALAEATGLTRRWVIVCVAQLVAHVPGFRKLPAGPYKHDARHDDGRLKNTQDVTHRHYRTGGMVTRTQSLGGAGWANGYLVEGIPDPDPSPPEPPAPAPEAPESPATSEQLAAHRERVERYFQQKEAGRARGP